MIHEPHRLHLLDILSLKDGLYGGGGDLVSGSDRPLPVRGTSFKSKGVPFCAIVAALVAPICQAAICKSTCFGVRVSRSFGFLDFMPHLMSARD